MNKNHKHDELDTIALRLAAKVKEKFDWDKIFLAAAEDVRAEDRRLSKL